MYVGVTPSYTQVFPWLCAKRTIQSAKDQSHARQTITLPTIPFPQPSIKYFVADAAMCLPKA